MSLQFASAELRGDRSFIMEVVKMHGGALEHASDELKDYRGVVMVAVKKSGWALEHGKRIID